MELLPLILSSVGAVHLIRKTLETRERVPEWDSILSKVWIASAVYFGLALLPGLGFLHELYGWLIYSLFLLTIWMLEDYRPARLFGLALLPYGAAYILYAIWEWGFDGKSELLSGLLLSAKNFSFLWLVGFGIYALTQINKERKQRLKEEEQIRQAEARKAELEQLVNARTTELTQQKDELERTLAELGAAQEQLIHSEKMASLGELTAGIAHEIQNPLNFVNNFSEFSVELARELLDEIEKPNPDQEVVREIVQSLAKNQEKINHHGKRAANIVTSMLQHSRSNTGKKEPADLNALADEYLRLSYHGLRARDKSFNSKMKIELDPEVGMVELVHQDIGRVLLNLINNAFHAVSQKKKQNPEAGFEPEVSVSTRMIDPETVEIRIRDNGTGIPEHLRSKIFQPFFTTKPTGQGTGLGLSLAFDIVTKGHAGTMEMETTEGVGTEFIIHLPKK